MTTLSQQEYKLVGIFNNFKGNIMSSISMGAKVKDQLTNFEGIVSGFSEYLSGQSQYAIQPQGDGSTYPDALNIDEHLLEVLYNDAVKYIPAVHTNYINLGSKVVDKISGFEGIATNRYTHINGCVVYTVTPAFNPKAATMFNEAPKGSPFDQSRLKVIIDKVIPQPEIGRVEGRPTGGPSTKTVKMNSNVLNKIARRDY